MILYYLASVFYVFVCILLLMVILLQQGKGDMAAAFGGGSSQSAFGARAGATVLSKATTVLAGAVKPPAPGHPGVRPNARAALLGADRAPPPPPRPPPPPPPQT